MTSLRTRLLAGLLGGLVLMGLAAGVVLYRTTLAQANAVFDEHLQDTALTLRDQVFASPLAPVPPELTQNDRDADLVVQVFSLDGVRVYLSQAHAVVPGMTTVGYSFVNTPEGRWRVFGVQTPLHFIQVAQPMAVREARAARLALRVLLAFALFLPVFGALVWVIVGRGLRPLQDLARNVESRAADLLDPLPEAGLADEARPLVAALNAQLRRLSALLDRERAFVADAAHELRTPLTALRLQVRALQSAPTTEHAVAAEAIARGVERASRLIEQLLALERQEQPGLHTHEPVALDALAREVVSELLPLADARSIELGLDADLDTCVQGDREGLALLLKNLLDNALRYSPAGTRVDVTVQREADGVVLSVSDDGPGIPPAERDRVFDRFYRMPGTAPGGSGLGLALVRTVAQRHGARLALQDGAGGCGLRISLYFPIPVS